MIHAQEHILIIKHGALGDIILSSGHIKAIRDAHPHAIIICLTGKPYATLLDVCPWIDEVWIDSKPSIKQVKEIFALIKKLRSRRFSWVYDLQTSMRSSLTWWFFTLPKPKFSGIARFASHPQRGNARHKMHALEQINDQLKIAGIVTDGTPDISWMSADISHFKLPERYMLIVAGGSAHRPEKRWPSYHYEALAKAMLVRDITPVLIGTVSEASVMDSIESNALGSINLCGKTSFSELASLARGARFAVGNDTGPLHLIAATGCKTTVIFSHVSTPEKSAPIGAHIRILRAEDLAQLSVARVLETLS